MVRAHCPFKIILCCCVSCIDNFVLLCFMCRHPLLPYDFDPSMIRIRVRNENSAIKSRHDVFCTIIAITALGLSMTDLVGALINLSPHRDVALTDFGCATNAEKPSGWLACTLAYAAPELVDRLEDTKLTFVCGRF